MVVRFSFKGLRKMKLTSIIFICLNIITIFRTAQSIPEENFKKDGIVQTTPRIIKQINKMNEDGTYTFGYAADDGSFKVESRNKGGGIKGKYGFRDPATGQMRAFEYTAGGRRKALPKTEYQITSATETEPQALKSDSRENTGSVVPSSSAENTSSADTGGNSNESGSSEVEDPVYNSFNAANNKKESGGDTSELSKRQGRLNGLTANGGAIVVGSQYGTQGQSVQPQIPYNIPNNNLQGGQFHRGFVDPRFQSPQVIPSQYSAGPIQGQYFSSQGGQQYLSGNPQQFSAGFSPGPPSHYVGRTFVPPSPTYIGTGTPQYSGLSPGTNGQLQYTSQLQNQLQPLEDGFVSGPAPSYFRTPQSQQFESPRGVISGFGGRAVQQPALYQQFPAGLGQYNQQSQGIGFSRFVSPSSLQGLSGSVSQHGDYVPNAQIDGPSDDHHEDGFVDPYPGNSASGNRAEADEKTPSVKNPALGQVVSTSPYSPQILGPQHVGSIGGPAGRVSFGSGGSSHSPYDEQGLQQVYQSQPGRGQLISQPLAYTVGQQQNPRLRFVGGSLGNSLAGFAPGQYQNQPIAYPPGIGDPGQGGLPIQGDPNLQGQILQSPQRPLILSGQGFQQYRQVPPQYLNSGQGFSGANQFPYDYVGGIGPNGFPIGGPQYLQQAQGIQGSTLAAPSTPQGSGSSPNGDPNVSTPENGKKDTN